MTDSTDDVDWYDDCMSDGYCPECGEDAAALRTRIAELEARLSLADNAREDLRTLYRALFREKDGTWVFSGSAEVHDLDEAMDRLAAWREGK